MQQSYRRDTVQNHLAYDSLLDNFFKYVDNNFCIRVERILILKHLPVLQIGETCLLICNIFHVKDLVVNLE